MIFMGMSDVPSGVFLMIEIQIDPKACVHCTLCVEACPTHVFEYDTVEDLPKVTKPKECFGCLACTFECPANAISHSGLAYATDFYRDPYALDLVSKIALGSQIAAVDQAQLQHGINDLGVRLLALGGVLKETLSSGLPAVGSLAGKTFATQLPRYKAPADLNEAIELAKSQFAPPWDLDIHREGDLVKIDVRTCFVREVCTKHGLPLGGELCLLFVHYLVGYLTSLSGLRLRLMNAKRESACCSYELKVYP